jgi:hypothetical protein
MDYFERYREDPEGKANKGYAPAFTPGDLMVRRKR